VSVETRARAESRSIIHTTPNVKENVITPTGRANRDSQRYHVAELVARAAARADIALWQSGTVTS